MENNKLPENLGAYEDPRDERDILFGAIQASVIIPSWEQGYSVEKKLGKQLQREDQFTSLSCVSFAISKYLEMLNFIEEKKEINLSPRFIYAQTYLQNGGSYPRDGLKIATKQGDSLEELCPSHPATEEQVRKKPSQEAIDNAISYKSKLYTAISDDWELIRQAIYQNNGCVGGFRSPSASIGHFVYFTAWRINQGRKQLGYIDSYKTGMDADGMKWMSKEDGYAMFSFWTLTDAPNWFIKKKMYSLYRHPINQKEVYGVKNGIKRHIGTKFTLEEGARTDWDWQEGEEIPVAPISIWDSNTEGAEIIFTPEDSSKILSTPISGEKKGFLALLKSVFGK